MKRPLMNGQTIATLNFKRVAGSQDTTKLNQYQTKVVYEKLYRISWSSSFEEGFENENFLFVQSRKDFQRALKIIFSMTLILFCIEEF